MDKNGYIDDPDLFPKMLEEKRKGEENEQLFRQNEQMLDANHAREAASRKAALSAKSVQKPEEEQVMVETTKARRGGFIKGIAIGAVSTALFISLAVPKIKEVINGMKLREAISTIGAEAEQVLLEKGLAVEENGKIKVLDNKKEDYYVLKLSEASSLEIFAYEEALGKEFDEAIQTASYNGGAWYYTGVGQYRTYHGYVDSNGEPSRAEEIEALRPALLEAYENNTLDQIVRSAEELDRGQGRGQ